MAGRGLPTFTGPRFQQERHCPRSNGAARAGVGWRAPGQPPTSSEGRASGHPRPSPPSCCVLGADAPFSRALSPPASRPSACTCLAHACTLRSAGHGQGHLEGPTPHPRDSSTCSWIPSGSGGSWSACLPRSSPSGSPVAQHLDFSFHNPGKVRALAQWPLASQVPSTPPWGLPTPRPSCWPTCRVGRRAAPAPVPPGPQTPLPKGAPLHPP